MIEYGFNFGVDYAITTELSQKKRVQDWLREN